MPLGANSSSSTAANSNNSNNNSNYQTTIYDGQNRQNNSYYRRGSTTITLANDSKEKEQVTRATIGNGNIVTGADLTLTFDVNGNLTEKSGGIESSNNPELTDLNRNINLAQEITKDQITGALDINTTIDDRLIAAAFGSDAARASIKLDHDDLDLKLLTTNKQLALLADETIELIGSAPIVGGLIRNTVTSPVEGLIDYFYENDSKLYTKDKNSNIVEVAKANLKSNYAINGIMVDQETAFANYLEGPGKDDLVLRHNPTSGFLGDLIESALDKTLGRIFPETSAMARLEATDYYYRGNIPDASNTAHSQGTIITDNAVRLFNDTYALGFDLDGNRLPKWYDSTINQTQSVNAVGPAVSEVGWRNSVTMSLGLEDKNINFEHKEHDSVLNLTSSFNPITIAKGLLDLIHISDHDVRNYEYSYYLIDSDYKDRS